MHSINGTRLTLDQLEQLAHKLSNYTMVHYNWKRTHKTNWWEWSLQNAYLAYDFNYSIGNSADRCWCYSFLLCICKNAPSCSKTFSKFWNKENPKEAREMLSGFPLQAVGYPNIKATSETVKETLEMLGINLSNFDKHRTHRNGKDGSKIATTSVWWT